MSKIQWPKLPKVFKRKWIAALRSGEYKQGKEELCRVNENKVETYCCLGVAARVAGHRVSKIKRRTLLFKEDNWRVPDVIKGDQSKTAHDYNPVVSKLTEMNDGDFGLGKPSRSFAYIANWIEKNL